MNAESYRSATAADVADVVSLVESAYRGESSRRGWCSEADLLDGQRVDERMVLESLADGDVEIVLVERGAELLACCELRRPDRRGTSALGMFAVDPELQGGGVGRAVLDHAAQVVLGWGGTAIEMTVIRQRVELIEWYRRRGYLPTGEERPFPYGDERFGRPRRDDLSFTVLRRDLGWVQLSRAGRPARRAGRGTAGRA